MNGGGSLVHVDDPPRLGEQRRDAHIDGELEPVAIENGRAGRGDDFFKYLSTPAVQADWHQFSGYLPITQAAYELGQQQGYYAKNPGSDVAIKEITLNPPTENSKGLRFGNYSQIRDIEDEEFQNLLSGKKTAQQALDSVVQRGDDLLRQFQSANQ